MEGKSAIPYVLAALSILASCGVSSLNGGALSARIALVDELPLPAKVDSSLKNESMDTLIIKNIDGRDMILMRSVRDDDGNMVATQVLEAATVTARFRNVAERHGEVEICFQIIVPRQLQESRWQLRYQPMMYYLGDTVALDKVIITGKEYRRRQLRGYQQYQRFLDRIIEEEGYFIRKRPLEIFLMRNIPQIYAFKTDSAFVSDEQFASAFGVSKDEAIRHYTDRWAMVANEHRKEMREGKFRRYVRSPILRQRVRLDTVILSPQGDYIYNYTQTIHTRPRLKKVDVALAGEIYEQDKKICDIGMSDHLSFYISSVSSFVDETPRYFTRIVERRAEASASYCLHFMTGKSELDATVSENSDMISEIKSNISSLVRNETFELDSITVIASASPEGTSRQNAILSRRRSEQVCEYFARFLRHYRDSLRCEEGISIVLDDRMKVSSVSSGGSLNKENIKFNPEYRGEDWDYLRFLIEGDEVMDENDKAGFAHICSKFGDVDVRERKMALETWYKDMRNRLYPKLRKVDFAFHMHRRGMVKDTVHTTLLDTLYMSGVQAIRDRDYDKAIDILRPYNDFNAAVAYVAKDFNHSALSILKTCPQSPQVRYMLALVHARLGNEAEALRCYLASCKDDGRFIHRGNLDPEISSLIKQYNINTSEL